MTGSTVLGGRHVGFGLNADPAAAAAALDGPVGLSEETGDPEHAAIMSAPINARLPSPLRVIERKFAGHRYKRLQINGLDLGGNGVSATASLLDG